MSAVGAGPVALVALAVAALLAGQPAVAQGPASHPAPGPERGIGWTGSWSTHWSRLDGAWCRHAGGELGLRLGGGTTVALAGYGTASPARADGSDLHLAYGGVRAAHSVDVGGRWAVTGAVLVGGGNVWAEDREAGSERNTGVAVLEPGVLVTARLGAVTVSAGPSYRWVRGGDGIARTRDADLGGLGFGLRFGVH